jgi:queuine tRNA-ribosyltransferase
MVLDECPPHGAPKEDLRSAVNRSVHWARRCREAHRDGEQALFGIVQGGSDLALREECATELSGMGFDGYAIGGVSVGEEKKLIREVVSHTAPRLPFDRPRYLMGVGSPGEMVAAIAAGIDFFDCVLPTRNGRNGLAFTSEGPVRIRGAAHVRDDRPLDVSCACPVCRKYSRAYLRHLAHSGELLAGTLLSMHNIRFFQDLVGRARGAVSEGGLGELLKWCDERYPLEKPDRSRSAP